MNDIGNRIASLLYERRLTQRNLAERIGATEVSVSRWISGERIPKATVIIDIANALNVPAGVLLGDEPNLQPTCNQLATDVISRQAAIDEIRNELKKSPTTAIRAMEVLKGLPSAQPETDGFCTGCKEYDSERNFCPRFDRVIKKTIEEMGIIHCKDCKHGELFSDQYLCRKAVCWREGDFYCGYAERREDGSE